jgi:hypothetical protein
MGTQALNRRLDRAAPDEDDGDYIFSEAEFRQAVKAAERILEECIASLPPLTKEEEKEGQEMAALLIESYREECKDEIARLVNPVHVQRLKDETNAKQDASK